MEPGKQAENLEKIHKIAEAVSAPIKKVFSGPDGKAALAVLEREFNGEKLFDINPYQTAYNLGARDVVYYIKQLNRYKRPKTDE